MLAPKEVIELTYTLTSNTDKLDGLSSADIIYEYIDKDEKTVCKALFHDNIPSSPFSKTNTTTLPMKNIPSFTFVDFINLPKNYSQSANSINVKLSKNIESKFIYENDYYIHYRNSLKDIDPITSKTISVSNVLIQFCNENKFSSPLEVNGIGKGILFLGGKIVDIRWEKEKSNPIKVVDEYGKPVSLLKGRTWWIILKNNSSIAYN